MSNSPSDFEAAVSLAMPFAERAIDAKALGERVAQWCDESGEPALFLTVVKNPEAPHRFPVAISFYRMDPKTRDGVEVGRFDVTRPDYDKNTDGFGGNHLVVAVLKLAADAIATRVRLPVEILTGQTAWRQFCAGSRYFALTEQRAIDYSLAKAASETPPPSAPSEPAPRSSRARL